MLCLASAERWRCFKWQQKAGAQKKKNQWMRRFSLSEKKKMDLYTCYVWVSHLTHNVKCSQEKCVTSISTSVPSTPVKTEERVLMESTVSPVSALTAIMTPPVSLNSTSVSVTLAFMDTAKTKSMGTVSLFHLSKENSSVFLTYYPSSSSVTYNDMLIIFSTFSCAEKEE